jgi:Flp pilus assembly protein TadD
MLLRIFLAFLMVAPLSAQPVDARAPGAPAGIVENPFDPPEELAAFARRATLGESAVNRRLQALLHAFFAPPEEGGLGLSYDGSRTRTLKEIWSERKANCLGMTALYVQACRSIGIHAQYGDPVNVGRWSRVHGLVRYERHLVATVPVPPLDDLVADFEPRLQKRRGRYILNLLPETRVRALWAANRAVERLDLEDLEGAERFATLSTSIDPSAATGWNILGVVRGMRGDASQAEAAYRKALSLEPMDPSVVGNLESLLRRSGRWDEAFRYRQLSLELRRLDPYFQGFLAEEAYAGGRFKEALAHIRSAVRLQPRDPDLHVFEAACRMALGQPDQAEQALEQARRWADPAQRERYDHKLAILRQPHG